MILDASKKAVEYYESLRKKHIRSGWEKIVCTDGTISVFVHRDYNPVGNEVVFKLDTRNGITLCELYKKA